MDIFERPENYIYEEGALLLGAYGKRGEAYPIGIKTERHAITFAGSGAGKGAAVLIPNAKLWPHNLLCIDPKGEVAAETYKDRKKHGQKVYVIDPFEAAKIPKTCRASFNPLDGLDVNSPDIKEDIEAISDGIIRRDNPESSHWDDGAQSIISGLIAYLLLRAPKSKQNLIELRAIIRNGDSFAEVIEEMKNLQGCAGLCESGASAAYAKEGGYFVSNAEKNTRWLDSERMKNSLVKTNFSMADLKQKPTSIYLVLPAKQLKNHGRFLRLFIRCALSEMMNPMPDGSEKGEECLFLLDEFFALGFIEEIMVSIGLMRSMGLKLWPVLQDIAQLEKLYGRDGMQTFFSNTDLHQFFGNTDPQTLDWISTRTGTHTMAEMPPEPSPTYEHRSNFRNSTPPKIDDGFGASLAQMGKEWDAEINQKQERDYNNTVSRLLGKPRLTSDQIASIIRKEGEGVAESCICFVYGMRRLNLHLLPHWLMNENWILWGSPLPALGTNTVPSKQLEELREAVQGALKASEELNATQASREFWEWMWTFFWVSVVVAVFGSLFANYLM